MDHNGILPTVMAIKNTNIPKTKGVIPIIENTIPFTFFTFIVLTRPIIDNTAAVMLQIKNSIPKMAAIVVIKDVATGKPIFFFLLIVFYLTNTNIIANKANKLPMATHASINPAVANFIPLFLFG